MEESFFRMHHLNLEIAQSSSLRVQQQTGDEDDHNRQELQKAHTDECVREEILLHGWVACHAHHEGCEELPDALRAATDGHHRDGTAEDGHAGVALAEGRTKTSGPRRITAKSLLEGRRGHEAACSSLGPQHLRHDTGSTDGLEECHSAQKVKVCAALGLLLREPKSLSQ